MKKFCITLMAYFFGSSLMIGQTLPTFDVDFTVDGQLLRNPLVGGFNSPQFSAADLNNDGIDDLYVFDRIGDVSLTFINNGTENEVDYDYDPSYANWFPKMKNWVLLRDFNEDGAMDIFAYSHVPSISGVQVYEGFFDNGRLKFKRFHFYNNEHDLIYFPLLTGGDTNLYISTEDYPAVDDIDYDGDLDIITFGTGGGYIYWYKNTSVENGYGTDSLHFVLEDICLGSAYESGLTGCVELSSDPDSCATGFWEGSAEQRHAGSTLLMFDEDNDGDKELVLGDVNSSTLNLLVNGGSATDTWYTAQDCSYPSYNLSALIHVFPASFYVDVDNDGRRDLLASPNSGQLAEDIENVWFYKNTNTDEEPVFNFLQNNLLVDDMLDLGTGAHPAFADFNADGLLDLLVGNETYYVEGGGRDPRLFLFHNIGTATEPAFELVDDNYLDMDQNELNWSLAPTFGDLDGDNDVDLLIGEEQGTLFYFENTAGPGNPIVFAPMVPQFMGIDVGLVSTPDMVDINRDGLMDLVVGERNGHLNYFENVGLVGNPQFFTDQTMSPNVEFLGNVFTRLLNEAEGYSSPYFVDFDGEYMLFCGSASGQIWRYDTITQNTNLDYYLADQPFGNVTGGFRTHPELIDINNDGVLDLVVGNRRGGLSFYHSGYNVDGTASNEELAKELEVLVFPNPSTEFVTFEIEGAGGAGS